MGLASSQARLLALTSRQHTLEGRAQRLMAEKQRLTSQSDYVYQKYINTLDEVNLVAKRTLESGDERWVGGSLYNLMKYGCHDQVEGTVFYVQNLNNGKLYLPKEYGLAFDDSADKYEFAEKFGVTYTEVNEYEKEYNEYYDAIFSGWKDADQSSPEYNRYVTLKTFVDSHPEQYYKQPNNYIDSRYYEEIYESVNAAGGWIEMNDTTGKSASWVINMIKSTQVIIATWDADSEILSKTASALHYDLREEANRDAIEKADQEYENDIAVINEKDTRYDTKLQKLESEREAIRTEIDSLKRVASDNITSTFKVFT